MKRVMPTSDCNSPVNVLIGAAILIAISGGAVALADSAESGTTTTDGAAVDIISAAESGMEDVVVTARRRAERAQDVPNPIATVAGGNLAAFNQTRLEDLDEHLPSTNIQYANPRQTSVAVRGLGNNPADDALEPSVGVYVDDVYLGRSGMANLDLADISQIELLRGPQGTLFGKNTTAGVLNISTARPTFDPEAEVDASYGNYGYYQLRVAASDALISDTLAARFSLVKTYQRGFVNDATDGRDLDGINRSGARAQLLWNPNEALSIRVVVDDAGEKDASGADVIYSVGPNGGTKYLNAIAAAGAHVVFDPNYETTTINGPQTMQSDNNGYSVEANLKLGDYTVTSISAYRSWFFEPHNDADFTNLDALRDNGQLVRDHQVTQELRLASPVGGPLTYVTGLYWFQQRQNNNSYEIYGADGPAIGDLALGMPAWADGQILAQQQLKTESFSVFAQSSWKPIGGCEFTAGMRDSYEQKVMSVEQHTVGSTNAEFVETYPARAIGPLSLSDDNVSALLSASYKLSPHTLVYASASRGAKSGTIDDRIPSGGLPLSSLYVAPETATDGEIGVKSTIFNRALKADANLFWTNISNYQSDLLLRPAVGTSFGTELTNVGGVKTRGVEIELELQRAAGLDFRFSGSLNDAKYTGYRNAPCSAESLYAAGNLSPGQHGFTCDLTGQRLVGAPEFILNPDASYSWTLGDGWTSIAEAVYSWRSWSFGSSDNSKYAIIPSYGLFNLRWRLERDVAGHPMSIAFWSKNLFDKRYVLGGLNPSGPLYNYENVPGVPRTFGCTLSWIL
jgi:iron complex outermembrane receptor protein